MTVNMNTENGCLTVAPNGKLDSNTVTVLEDALRGKLDSTERIIFDFSELSYISSAGLRLLLTVHKAKNGAMTVRNVNEDILEIFRITGMAGIFNAE